MIIFWFIWVLFFFASRRPHTMLQGDGSSDVCSSDLALKEEKKAGRVRYIGAQTIIVKNQSAQLEALMRNEPLDFIGVDRSEERRVGTEERPERRRDQHTKTTEEGDRRSHATALSDRS